MNAKYTTKQMKSPVKAFHMSWMVFIVPINVCLFILNGRILYAILADQKGLIGNMPLYYNLPEWMFLFYTGFSFATSSYFLVTLSRNVVHYSEISMRKALLHFSIFLLAVIFCEVYFQYQFVGKG